MEKGCQLIWVSDTSCFSWATTTAVCFGADGFSMFCSPNRAIQFTTVKKSCKVEFIFTQQILKAKTERCRYLIATL